MFTILIDKVTVSGLHMCEMTYQIRVIGVAQWVKVLSANTDDLSLTSDSHTVGGENQLYQLPSDFLKGTVVYTHTINKQVSK